MGPDGKRGIAYLDFPLADPVEALHCILEAGGVPVLAHPGQYGNYDFVPTRVREGLQGIEVRHPGNTARQMWSGAGSWRGNMAC